jgi:hypothetical protein
MPRVMLGSRNVADAYEFVADLASRLRNRVQLTSDDHRWYLEAVEAAFGADIDDAMLVNFYGPDQQQPKATARRQTRPTDLVGMKSLTERLDVVVEPGFV